MSANLFTNITSTNPIKNLLLTCITLACGATTHRLPSKIIVSRLIEWISITKPLLTDNNFITGQIDFVTPVGNGGRIETGYKFSMRNTMQEYHQYIGSDTNNLKENISDANNYNYDEYINAAYFIYSNTVKKKFKYQIGLRGELANNVFFLRNVDTNTRSFYPNIFPTLHLAYDINKNNTISLSYSMRVRRPNIFQLNLRE